MGCDEVVFRAEPKLGFREVQRRKDEGEVSIITAPAWERDIGNFKKLMVRNIAVTKRLQDRLEGLVLFGEGAEAGAADGDDARIQVIFKLRDAVNRSEVGVENGERDGMKCFLSAVNALKSAISGAYRDCAMMGSESRQLLTSLSAVALKVKELESLNKRKEGFSRASLIKELMDGEVVEDA